MMHQLPGAEPEQQGLHLDHEHGRSLRVRHDDMELLRYVYQPWDPQLEAPRPYFHPIRTLGGRAVSLYRPHDHVWHKGIAWSLPNVGSENFWGGPTFVRDKGYVQLPNNGTTAHLDFDGLESGHGSVVVRQQLEWITQAGERWFTERRAFTVSLLADAWTLGYTTTFTNRSGQEIRFGSPTTEGRPDAGYGGLFWRGPRSFTGGRVYAADQSGGDELNGIRAPWLALVGRHDGDGGASTLVFVDSSRNSYGGEHEHTQWFVRSTPYACISPSPFYAEELALPADASLTYEYAVVIADDDRGVDGSATLAHDAQKVLLSQPLDDGVGS